MNNMIDPIPILDKIKAEVLKTIQTQIVATQTSWTAGAATTVAQYTQSNTLDIATAIGGGFTTSMGIGPKTISITAVYDPSGTAVSGTLKDDGNGKLIVPIQLANVIADSSIDYKTGKITIYYASVTGLAAALELTTTVKYGKIFFRELGDNQSNATLNLFGTDISVVVYDYNINMDFRYQAQFIQSGLPKM